MSALTAANGQLTVAATIPSSWLHETFRAAELRERAAGHPVAKLHVGEPYFDPPQEVAEAVAGAVRRGDTGYTSVEGILELRAALVQKLRHDNGVDAAVDRVFVTPGSCQGLAALLRTIVEPGAEILLPELHWPVHLQQALLAGFRPVFYPLDAELRPDPAAVLAAATPRTRVLLLNSPANPTGVVLDTELMGTLLELARTQRWQIVSDEAYEHFVYQGEHVSIASLERDVPVAERLVHSVFSFSKSFAMTGYRLGYVVAANEETARALGVVQEASIIGPSTPVQYAGLAALRLRSVIAETNRSLVRHNRDTYLPALREAGFIHALPAGGWYAMADVSHTSLDAETFAARLLVERDVAVVPGTGFALRPSLDEVGRVRSITPAPWSRQLVRIAFCVDPGVLAAGVRELIDFTAIVTKGAA